MDYLIAAAMASGLAIASGTQNACVSERSKHDVITTLDAFYIAAERGSREALERLTTSDFHLFEEGKDITRSQVVGMMQAMHDKHVQYHWNVEEPHVQVDCSLASVTYINRGSITKNGQSEPATWLESAILRDTAGVWQVQFLQSEKVNVDASQQK